MKEIETLSLALAGVQDEIKDELNEEKSNQIGSSQKRYHVVTKCRDGAVQAI
jgi:hypothetical protein